MNAAIRSVIRTALARGWEVRGVRNGYEGLLAGDLFPLRGRDIGGIIQRGGTLLGSSRCPAMKTEEGRRRAADALLQRAGAPSAFDRILSTRMGAAATERIAAGETGVLAGLRDGRMAATPLSGAAGREKTLDPELLELARVLAR